MVCQCYNNDIFQNICVVLCRIRGAICRAFSCFDGIFQMLKYYFYIVISGSLWGCMGLIVKSLQQVGFTSMHLSALRPLIAVLAIGVFFLIKDPQLFRIRLDCLPWLALAGGLGNGLYNIVYFTLLEKTSISFAAAMSYTSPAFVTVFSLALFKEHLDLQKVLSLGMTVSGCILVTGFLHGELHYGVGGLLGGLLTGLAYSAYSLFTKMAVEKGCKSQSATFYSMLSACLVTIPFAHLENMVPMLMNPTSLFGVILLGLFCSAFPSLLYSKGMTCVESSKASMIATVELIVSAILGVFVFHDALSLDQAAGIMLILGAVIILSIQNKERSGIKNEL